MKVCIETGVQYPEVLKEFHVEHISREWAKYLVPDPYVYIPLDKFPRLKIISTPSTGTNHIDLVECNKRGIKVLSLLDDRKGLETIQASSEFAFFMILAGLRMGGWRQWKTYTHDSKHMLGRELYGKKVGILGFGRIGQNVAKWLTHFGAEWRSCDLGSDKDTVMGMFEWSDIVLISCSLNDKTRGMITEEYLSRLGRDTILVNVARAEIIDEDALINWAKKGGLYVSDVIHGEVKNEHLDSPLLFFPNVIIFPHIGGHTVESNEKALRIALGLLRKEIDGKNM